MHSSPFNIHNTLLFRLALLQLAVQNSVFLLDMLTLPKAISQYELKNFFVSIFGNCKILKLGEFFPPIPSHSHLSTLFKRIPD